MVKSVRLVILKLQVRFWEKIDSLFKIGLSFVDHLDFNEWSWLKNQLVSVSNKSFPYHSFYTHHSSLTHICYILHSASVSVVVGDLFFLLQWFILWFQVLCYKCCSLKSRLEYMNFTEARVCQPCFTILEACKNHLSTINNYILLSHFINQIKL